MIDSLSLSLPLSLCSMSNHRQTRQRALPAPHARSKRHPADESPFIESGSQGLSHNATLPVLNNVGDCIAASEQVTQKALDAVEKEIQDLQREKEDYTRTLNELKRLEAEQEAEYAKVCPVLSPALTVHRILLAILMPCCLCCRLFHVHMHAVAAGTIGRDAALAHISNLRQPNSTVRKRAAEKMCLCVCLQAELELKGKEERLRGELLGAGGAGGGAGQAFNGRGDELVL